MDALEPFKAVHRALARLHTVGEVAAYANRASAAMTLCKKAKLGTENYNLAAEAKILAERQAGEMLAEVTGGRGGKREASNSVLLDLGIERMQSHRWQRIAAIPSETLLAHIEGVKASGKEITTRDILKLAARQAAEPVIEEQIEHETRRVSSLEELNGEKFGTIYADPPWRYGNQATRASTDNHYDTMSVDDIAAMPISEFAADDAHLHIWTTNAFLPDTFRVITAWGFEYRSCFVWVKPQMGIGNYWRVSHEFLLLGIRGDAKRFKDRGLTSWGEYERGKHSSKPEVIRELIERASPGPFLEMFGRTQREGWTVFGNQVSGDVQRRLTG